ncbi:MAG: YfhO family protein [Erysipelotrichaceae bacterium]|nr:YfhO family protein [Erysipelotrichaceae bacterium]
MIKKQKNLNYYLIYSLLFVVTSLAVFSYFYLNGKTLISHGDGIRQHYKVFVYFADYLKQIIRNLFTEHRLILPQWDFNIGEGSDILASMHYYAINDPFTFPVLLVPERYVYLYFQFVSVLKIYLAGLVFVHLCLYTKKENIYAVLSGSMIYVFCYWVLLNITKHTFFLTPMLCLPLIILGVEKVIREDKTKLFLWSVFLCAISQIYFFYMIVIMTVLYVAIRALTLYQKDVKRMFLLVWKLLVPAVLAVGMAAVVVAPMVYVLLSNGRIGVDYALHLFYERFYYERLFTVLLADDYPDWLCMGFAAPVILSFLLCFKNIRKDPFLASINIAVILFMLFPVFGKIFNGMGYVVNRWSFAIALVAAYTFVCEYEEFVPQKKLLLIAVPVFILAGMVSAWSRTLRVIVPCVFALAYTCCLFLKSKYREALLLALVVLNICFNADHVYSIRGSDKRSISSISVSQAQNVVQENEAYELKQYLKENGIDGQIKYSGSDLNDNVSMLNDLSSTNYYFSLANPFIASMRSKLGLCEYSMYRFYSLDQRGTLLSLGNVRYYLTPEGYDDLLPYGYVYVKTLNGYDLYEDTNALPLAYTYANAISYEKWDAMDPVMKEEAMMQAIVIDEGNDDVDLPCEELPYTVTYDEGIETAEYGFNATEDKATVHLQFAAKANCDYYLSIHGLDYWDGRDYYDETLADVEITVKANDRSRIIEYHTNEYEFYNGRHDYVAYLGYYEDGLKELAMELSNAGMYSYAKLSVICVDRTGYADRMKELGKVHPEEIVFGTDEISCRITADEERYMLLSVPYAEGWKAYVDGKETEVLRANECYMAIRLDKGTHEVKLTYETPYLKLGALISAVSLVAVIAYMAMQRRRNRIEKLKQDNEARKKL